MGREGNHSMFQVKFSFSLVKGKLAINWQVSIYISWVFLRVFIKNRQVYSPGALKKNYCQYSKYYLLSQIYMQKSSRFHVYSLYMNLCLNFPSKTN